MQTDHVLYVCFTDYLDKEDTEVMKRRGDAEKGFPKSRSGLGKNQGAQREKVKMAAAGKILEMGEDAEDEGGGWRQMPGDAQGP